MGFLPRKPPFSVVHRKGLQKRYEKAKFEYQINEERQKLLPMLRSLYVQKEIVVQDNILVHVYNLSGELCSTDAIWLKDEFQNFSYSEEILLDLSQVIKIDLTAINALAKAHKRHRLSVVMPIDPEAAELFYLTKFTDILVALPAIPAYQEMEVFA